LCEATSGGINAISYGSSASQQLQGNGVVGVGTPSWRAIMSRIQCHPSARLDALFILLWRSTGGQPTELFTPDRTNPEVTEIYRSLRYLNHHDARRSGLDGQELCVQCDAAKEKKEHSLSFVPSLNSTEQP